MTDVPDALPRPERIILVTGSTRGIGEATARHFATGGDLVVVHGTDVARGRQVVSEIRDDGGRAVFLAADLRDEIAVRSLVPDVLEACGRLDVLVNNAGQNAFHGVLGTTLADWTRCLDLDLRAAWLLSRAAAPVMAPGSAIVNVSSNHAFATLPGVFPYNVAKAGMQALTQSLALELADLGIRANAVCPGYIDTPINVDYFATFPDPAAERARVEAMHPLRRIGRPDEVAHAIAFLADEHAAGFITGTTLLVDGGRSALMQDPR